MRETCPLGTFSIVSGRIGASDPCYASDTWCRGVLEGARKGTWVASMEMKDRITVMLLSIRHEDIHTSEGLTRHRAPFMVDVTSGQAGFFDEKYYRDYNSLPEEERFEDGNEEDWYIYCCELTFDDGGVLPYGVVTHAGEGGDAVHPCYYYTDANGEIVMAELHYDE